MVRRMRSLTLLTVLALVAGPGAAQEEQGRPPPEGNPCFGGVVAMNTALVETGQPRAWACPCFDQAVLEALPELPWAYCVDGAQVTQGSSWYGKMAPRGREGFNVMVVRTSARSAQASCQFLHRYLGDNGTSQDYERVRGLSSAQAESCSLLVSAWLRNRGGCQSTP